MLDLNSFENRIDDYTFRRYYNYYFFNEIEQQLLADIEDAYHENTSVTYHDTKLGAVTRHSRSVEDTAGKIISMRNHLEKLREKHSQHKRIFKLATKDYTKQQLYILDHYFKLQCEQERGDVATADFIEQLKRDLYTVEQSERKKRYREAKESLQSQRLKAVENYKEEKKKDTNLTHWQALNLNAK